MSFLLYTVYIITIYSISILCPVKMEKFCLWELGGGLVKASGEKKDQKRQKMERNRRSDE